MSGGVNCNVQYRIVYLHRRVVDLRGNFRSARILRNSTNERLLLVAHNMVRGINQP
jgi:hypothetical protein